MEGTRDWDQCAMNQLTCSDWRSLPEAQLLPLYSAENQRWASILEWDATSNWLEIERGRQLGTVPGFVVTNERRAVVGWSYYIIQGGTLQIGGFVSASEACTALMLSGILTDEALASVSAVTFFSFGDAVGLVEALKRRGLNVGRYWYMSRDASPRLQPLPWDARRWRPEDAGPTADLLKSAYKSPDDTRPFAPQGTAEQWRQYVDQLVASSGCGTLLGEASMCVSAGPGRLSAVALVSRIAEHVGHVVQIAVAPEFQQRGLGAALLEAACGVAARAGCDRITLLVGGQNRTARRLYDGARFQARTSMISAGLLTQPRRLTSVEPGFKAMTLR